MDSRAVRVVRKEPTSSDEVVAGALVSMRQFREREECEEQGEWD